MKQVKASLFLKILIFFIFIISFCIVFIIPKNIFGWYNIFPIFSLLSSIIVFFYVLKNNLLAIKWFPFTFLLNIIGVNYVLWGVSSFFEAIRINQTLGYNWVDKILESKQMLFNIPILIFFIIICILLYFFNKRLKKGVENLEEKYVTEKKQHKNFIIILSIPFFLLLLFRFGYYERDNINIEEIDDSFFITKYENVDIKNEDNLLDTLIKEDIIYKWNKKPEVNYFGDRHRLLKEEIINCLYWDNCSLTLEDYKVTIDEQRKTDKPLFIKSYWQEETIKETKSPSLVKEQLKIKIQKEKPLIKSYLQNNIDILYEFYFDKQMDYFINKLITEWSNKKYFKSEIYDEIYTYVRLIVFNRDLKYKILYYLNNNEEDKAIQILKAQIKVGYIILDGDNSLIETLVAIVPLKMGFENMNLILNNYELSKKSKLILGSVIKKEIDFSSLENSLKNEHKANLNNIQFLFRFNKISFFDFEFINKGGKENIFYIIKNKGVLSENIKNKYQIKNINFFKNNLYSKIMLGGALVDYSSQYKKISDLEQYRKNLVDMLKQ